MLLAALLLSALAPFQRRTLTLTLYLSSIHAWNLILSYVSSQRPLLHMRYAQVGEFLSVSARQPKESMIRFRLNSKGMLCVG